METFKAGFYLSQTHTMFIYFIIRKWKENNTPSNLPMNECPPKLTGWASRVLIT